MLSFVDTGSNFHLLSLHTAPLITFQLWKKGVNNVFSNRRGIRGQRGAAPGDLDYRGQTERNGKSPAHSVVNKDAFQAVLLWKYSVGLETLRLFPSALG